MPVTATPSNQFKLENFRKEHDLVNDELVAILLDATFVFDPDTHATLADLAAHEIATGYGYTQQNKALTNKAAAIDAANDKAIVSCGNLTWTAAGGDIPAVAACAIYNNTHASKTVVLCIEYGTSFTIPDGTSHQIDLSSGLIEG